LKYSLTTGLLDSMTYRHPRL